MVMIIEQTRPLAGLSSAEAAQRLRAYGRNEVPEVRPQPLKVFLNKLRGPVPWMLEATFIFQLLLGKPLDATITFALLITNALISFAHEEQAQAALAALRQRLVIRARVLRDGTWGLIPSQELVPGDVIRLRMGDLVPADVSIQEGEVEIDQAILTGESLPVAVGAGGTAYAASVIQRGEGTGTVSATGLKTFYGKTAMLVQNAHSVSHAEQLIQRIVSYLMVLNGALIAVMLVYALIAQISMVDMFPFMLILLIASIPVAMPATFALGTAIGAQELSRRGVLTTRLAGIQEAASMDILCTDKTGTLTSGEQEVARILPFDGFTDRAVLALAALASDPATHDAIDSAILAAAGSAGAGAPDPSLRTRFIPFDSATKRTEAFALWDGKAARIVKGMPQIVAALADPNPALEGQLQTLAADGLRVVAVAVGAEQGPLTLAGMIGLQDPPRDDSASVIAALRGLGVKVVMITGDTLETARSIAAQVGITGPATTAESLRLGGSGGRNHRDYDVYAGVFPEDKYKLVQALQADGHIIGMTGDGVNDAPALKQAEVGIAVANATDVAKGAASLVLTTPGLSNMLATVDVGRKIYQRLLTYTVNKLVKTFQVSLFLSVALILTGQFVTRPTLILLLLLANDFVTMSLTTDRVVPSATPDHWNVRSLVIAGVTIAAGWIVFAFGVLFIGAYVLALSLDQVQTLIFVMLVFTGQANVYLIRQRRHLWASLPSRWMMLATSIDFIVVSLFAISGVFMTAVSPILVGGLLLATIAYTVLLDLIKVPFFNKIGLNPESARTA